MNTEAIPQQGLVAYWAAEIACLGHMQEARASVLLVHPLLERLEHADDELRADVLRIMERTLQDVSRALPVSRAADSRDPGASGHGHWFPGRARKRGRRRA